MQVGIVRSVKLLRWFCLPFALHALAVPLGSDPLVITRAMTATTIAEIYIESDSVLVELEIGVRDLEGFRNLLPDQLYEMLGNQPEPLASRLPRFFLEDMTIRPDGGLPIRGRVLELFPAARRHHVDLDDL